MILSRYCGWLRNPAAPQGWLKPSKKWEKPSPGHLVQDFATIHSMSPCNPFCWSNPKFANQINPEMVNPKKNKKKTEQGIRGVRLMRLGYFGQSISSLAKPLNTINHFFNVVCALLFCYAVCTLLFCLGIHYPIQNKKTKNKLLRVIPTTTIQDVFSLDIYSIYIYTYVNK